MHCTTKCRQVRTAAVLHALTRLAGAAQRAPRWRAALACCGCCPGRGRRADAPAAARAGGLTRKLLRPANSLEWESE